MISYDPWASAKDRLNKFARQDSRLVGHLNDLSEQQAADDKLAFAIEAGRTYGMRTRKCYALLRQELTKDFRHPPTETAW